MSREFKQDMSEEDWRWIFAERLRDLLERNEMSQASFADYMDLTIPMVSKYVNAQSTPRIGTLLRMCSVLDCELSDLIC